MANWSTYQQNVFNFVANGKGSAVVSAVAGSGKTTTIVECAKRIPSYMSVLFLAFNKSIATELQSRLAPYRNVNCCTLHSHGYKAIIKGGGTSSQTKVNQRKYRDFLTQNVFALSNIIAEDTEENIQRSFVINASNLFDKCRINLVKSGEIDMIEKIANHHSIDLIADEAQVVSTMLSFAYHKNSVDEPIDFTDMLTLACTQFNRFVSKYDFVFIDECQDLSKAQRELMLLSLKPNGRFIAVGDRNQAINGFAGAGCDSFDLLSDLAKNNELPLSVNYRCGKSIISLAQQIVPQIQAFEGQNEGNVFNVTDLNDLMPNDMVLCRKSAPLVRLCLKMLANNIIANVKGKDLGENLLKLIDRLRPKNIFYLYQKLDNELLRIKSEQEKRGKKNVDTCAAVVSFQDKIECIKAFAETSQGIAEMKRKIEYVFSDEQQRNAITLSTIHKSKGLESNRVFIILPDKLPLTWKGQQDWEYQQEMNLKYVAITRAKQALFWVNLNEEQIANYQFNK